MQGSMTLATLAVFLKLKNKLRNNCHKAFLNLAVDHGMASNLLDMTRQIQLAILTAFNLSKHTLTYMVAVLN